jgi:catechol 2,3-dioxygenase-like lactoylglutathione lyase family enzyme
MSLSTNSCKRPGALGVHSVHAFAFSVPDLAEAERFYAAFGLDTRREGGRLHLHTFGHPHRWGSLAEAPGPKQLQYVSFGCFAEDFDALAARADALGAERCPPHPLGAPGGLWLRHPDGFAVQVLVADKSMPDTASVGVPDGTNTLGRGRAPNRSRVLPVHPRRLAHMLFFSPDVQRAVEFYEGVLGLRVSDRSGDGIAFIHGVHGSDHRLIAVAKSTGAACTT